LPNQAGVNRMEAANQERMRQLVVREVPHARGQQQRERGPPWLPPRGVVGLGGLDVEAVVRTAAGGRGGGGGAGGSAEGNEDLRCQPGYRLLHNPYWWAGVSLWRECARMLELIQNQRQQHGSDWAGLLNDLRVGVTPERLAQIRGILLQRVLAAHGGPLPDQPFRDTMRIYPTNDQVGGGMGGKGHGGVVVKYVALYQWAYRFAAAGAASDLHPETKVRC
jgi:hypothetical protein